MRRPTRRRRPGARGARLVGFATVVQVIPGTAAPCPDTAGRRRPAAADDPERAPPRTDRTQERVPGLAAADRAADRPRQHLPGRHLGQRRGRRRQTDPFLGERHRFIACRLGSRLASSPPGAPSWSSPGTCCPTQTPLPRPRPGVLRRPHRPERRKRSHIRQPEALDYTVTLQPAV
jgi:hypothetical protein